ncbi:hypothetical protein M404DRAFT_1002450 [Pisolithus tinctorius Marx 270]|uniref:Uncharacterized protein n=1 Tax=Pisolithus tinctorius Marx 270 TaxID=870435 RepID=A0A0C3P4Q7_PISTI|nr:hypothetical protein M404DRAFT_1002450 [Pisolithus tinctorius Marx 270]
MHHAAKVRAVQHHGHTRQSDAPNVGVCGAPSKPETPLPRTPRSTRGRSRPFPMYI